MNEECVFCRIVAGELHSDMVYQDKDFVAFRDISPQAPKHVLVVPRAHIKSLADLTEAQEGLAGRLLFLAKKLAEKEGISASGYRVVINCGSDGGQVVPHLHLHLLGGRKLSGRLG
jgi:histidine triad (HIT) family protein